MRMKKIRFLLLTLVALLAGVSAQGKTVYIQPNDWANDDAVISLNVWVDGSGGNIWVTLTEVETGILKATFDDSFDKMAILRANEGYGNKWKSEDSENVWNQSGDITITDGCLYSINSGSWDGAAPDNGITVSDYTEPVSAGYTVDFNTKITTSNHDFKVAKGWGHIVSTNDYDGQGPYYMSYSYYASMGVGSTGCLWASRQYAGDYNGGGVVNDILVTPAVNGTVTLDVKAYGTASSSNPAYVEVYAINSDGTLGSLLKTVKEDIAGYNNGNNTEWATFTLAELTEEQKLGLRCQYVYIDNFTASSVNIPLENKLEVTSVANMDGQTGTSGTNPQFEQQADGNMKVQLKVTLSNTGDYDFIAGTTENYTLTPAQAAYASGTKTYYDDATIAIPENIAAGETKTFDVEFTVPYVSGYKYWFVRENVTGTTSSSYRYATAVAYESKFVLREAGSTSTSDLTTTQDYGRVSSATTRSFEIYNDGTAPLTIMSIALPEGFTSDNLPEIPAEGLVVAKKSATDAFNVTLPVDVMGDISGNLVIEYVKAGDTEATQKTLTFKGTVLQEGIWFADFNGNGSTNDGVYPEGSVVTSSTTLQFGYTGAYGSYDNYLKSHNSAGLLVLPKLTATAGAQLKYDAVKYQSGNSYTLKVYVSTDRNSLGEAKATISNSDLETSGERYTQTLTFDEAGDYYVAFELYGVGLDNVIGLTKTEVTHDLYFKETNLIAEAQTGKEIKPNVKVIPLTNETADGYTVKYYVDNEAVAEGTAIALTSSATADKTFTIAYTPTDEVTTEHDTYIEFEFADGTKIATQHQTLRVTNEPKFLFVAANTSVSQYTTNLTTAQAFGKVNVATESKSFKIYNQGTAPLQVTSIVAPEGFSVNKTEAFEVAAGASEDIIVTFDAATPGEYAGNLVVTYVQDGAEPYELAFSGTMLDQTKWYANFDNATTDEAVWPAGSVYQSKVSSARSNYSAPYNYYITSSSTTGDNMFITPKLSGNAGDKLQFDAIAYNSSWYSSNLKVYLAETRDALIADGATPVLVISNDNLSKTEYKTFEVELPAAGEYYIGIAMFDSPKVDELYGLTLADVAHDLQIASSNIPAEGMQNVASTATVNIFNFGLANDNVTVTAYVDGEAVATSEAAEVAMNHKLSDAGTQVSVSFVYPQVGTFPVYLEVKAGDLSLATEPVDVNFVGEIATAEGIQVGTQSSTGRDYGFVDWYMNDGSTTRYTDILYPASKISAAGIKAGDKIASISFKGSNNSKSFKAEVTSWVGTSTGDITFGSPDKASMQQITVYTGTVQFPANIESVITLAEPIVWDGTSDIRVYTEAIGQGSGNYMSVQYAYDKELTMSYNGTTKYGPVAFFTLVAESPVLAGTVKTSAGAGIGGATVTLKAENGVQYSATADESGAYKMNVIQAGLNFTATVEADGYLKREFALNMGGESKTNDVTMYQWFGLVGNMPNLSESEDVLMTQSEDDPNIFTLEMKNVEVTAGEYWYKLRADGKWASEVAGEGYQLPADVKNFNHNFETSGTYNFLFTFDWTNHTLTFERPYTLAEDANGVMALNWVDVTVEREFKAGWNAVVLPFALSADEVTAAFGENSELAVYDGDSNENGAVTVKFKKISGADKYISAGYPYMLWLENAVSGLKFTKNISADLTTAEGTSFDFVGVYAQTTNQDGDYIVQGGEFRKASTSNYVRPFRAYLKLKEGAAPVRSLSFSVSEGGSSTEISAAEISGLEIEGAYNLRGQKVTNLNRKGLYIINGKKVYVK